MSNKQMMHSLGIVLTITVILFSPNTIMAAPYTLEEAISKAQSQDPWIVNSLKQQESMEALSVHAGSLPDPTVSLAFANLPIDTFDFSQEPMTQFKVGVAQMFPRGKSRTLAREKLKKMSQMQPYARDDRDAQVSVTVSHLWLDIYRFNKTIRLIERDRSLFEYLVDVAQSSYTTASGKTRQQDLVRAQLELTRLDDRLTILQQQQDIHRARLSEWLIDSDITIKESDLDLPFANYFSSELINKNSKKTPHEKVADMLTAHPKVKQIDQKIDAFLTNVNLSKQSYKPQWGVTASYGYRDESILGEDRSDFFSVGVTFDVPIFTGNRQDKKIQSAIADQESVKTERALIIRQLKSGFEAAQSQYSRLAERDALFQSRLLKEMAEQAEASLSAYTNDDGDFSEVVRARIAELNARIEHLNISIDMQKSLAQLNYFQVGTNTDDSSYSKHQIDAVLLNENATAGEHHE